MDKRIRFAFLIKRRDVSENKKKQIFFHMNKSQEQQICVASVTLTNLSLSDFFLAVTHMPMHAHARTHTHPATVGAGRGTGSA